MRRPTILVDQDGPLADFDRRYFELCAAMGWPMDCEPEGQRLRFAEGHILDREHRQLARRHIHESRWFRDLPVTEGAVDGLNRLSEHADIWICTKPLEANITCRDDKAAWIERHFGEDWVRRLIIAPDKRLIRGDVLLDDAPLVKWLDDAPWRPVIFSTVWNGPGSDWGHLPRWCWADPIDELLEHGEEEAD